MPLLPSLLTGQCPRPGVTAVLSVPMLSFAPVLRPVVLQKGPALCSPRLLSRKPPLHCSAPFPKSTCRSAELLSNVIHSSCEGERMVLESRSSEVGTDRPSQSL